jgi:hypothetical protein
MNTTITPAPTNADIQAMKDKITELDKFSEYKKLKEELTEKMNELVNTPNEFEGAMKMPDTQKVLKTKRKSYHFIDVLFNRLKGMFAIRPIIGNIIALIIAGIAFYYIFNKIPAWFKNTMFWVTIGVRNCATI